MNLKIFSILALLVVVVCVFTATANPAEKHVTEMAQKSEHASEDHHAAGGKVDAAPSHDVKKVKDGMTFVPRHAREEKAAHQHENGTKHQSKKTKHVPKAAEAAQRKTIMKNSITIGRELFDYLALHLRETAYDGVENYIRFMTTFLGLKELTAEPLAPGMLCPVVNDITWFRYPISIDPCRFSHWRHSRSRSLFISVISGTDNFERRAAIRRTWPVHLKNQTNFNNPLDVVGFGFVIGLTNDSSVQQKIKEESEQFGDILQVNMIDRYLDLSVKVASLFNWVDTYCPRVDYVLKVDDDVYVNVHNLATVLHSLTVADQSIYGRQCGGNIPDRKGSKWMTSYENWPWQKFPIYFQGAGMVIAGSAVRPILAAMQVTPYFIWDDMYLVGLCAVKAKVQLRTSNQIFIDMPANYADPCFVRTSVMWTTSSSDAMNSSHFASHNFYQNPPKAHCIGKDNKTNDKPANHTDFPFGTALQN